MAQCRLYGATSSPALANMYKSKSSRIGAWPQQTQDIESKFM